jgi:hypothetical protein
MTDQPIDPRFSTTFFVVEANSNETLEFWRDVATEAWAYGRHYPGGESPKRYSWVQDSRGLVVHVGDFGGYPVNISCLWVAIDGRSVLFYYACSMVVHHGMIDDWLERHCNPRWDGGTRRAHCNSMNFHLCLNAIEDAREGP